MIKKLIFLKRIIGCNVFDVSAGPSTGSILLFSFGTSKRERDYSIMIYSAWRLDCLRTFKPLTGNNESNKLKRGNLLKEIFKLENDIVSDVIVNKFGDFEIVFQSQKSLKVFCDITPKVDETELDENWDFSIHKKNVCYTHTNKFTIKSSKYD
jgi:hypothetical protein